MSAGTTAAPKFHDRLPPHSSRLVQVMQAALSILGLAALALVMALTYTRSRRRRRDVSLAERIDAILPQTQCGQCGYPGCQPYAEAIAKGEADINQCPPGGAAGIRKLARLLDREIKPLSAAHGVEQPRAVAFIDEQLCIGCTLCIQACPVDAIVGAAKQMHTIVASLCTGCALCLPPCPVDCIRMLPLAQRQPLTFWLTRGAKREADAARQRFKNRNLRLERERQEKAARFLARAETGTAATDPKKALIAAAIERARLQKEQVKPQNVTDLSPETRASIAAIEARRVSPNHASDRAADRTAEGTNTPPAEEP